MNKNVVGIYSYTSLIPEQAKTVESSTEDILKTIEYSWLVGSPERDRWRFVENLNGQYDSRLVLSWKSTFEATNLSAKARWISWVNYMKFAAIDIIESSTKLNAPASQKAKVQNLKYIAQFMCFQRHRATVEEITKGDITDFESHLKQRMVSVSYVSEMLRTLRQLWSYEFKTIKSMRFDPYVGSSLISKKAKEIGVKNGHTTTLSPEEGLTIIEKSLTLVCNSEKILSDWDMYRQLKTTYASPAHAYKTKTKRQASDLIKNVRLLYGAAIVICLSLTAMRKHELSEITVETATKLVLGDTDILTGKVRKTARVAQGKETERTTVPELVAAINVVLRLTSDVREKYKSNALFLGLSTHNCVAGGKVKSVELGFVSLYLLLELVAKHCEYTSDNLRPHMFRRFFSLMWAWRFEVGDLHYLSKMLYHNGFEFTTAYTEDEDVWQFLPEEYKELTYSIFEDTLVHDKKVGGGFSRAIERYKRLIQANVSIVSPEQTSALIEKLIERNNYIVMPAADGYCFMSESRAKNAKCSKDGVLPDYSNRNENVCGSCSNFGTTSSKKIIWQKRKEAHHKTYSATKSETIKEQAKKGIALAERMLDSINLKEV